MEFLGLSYPLTVKTHRCLMIRYVMFEKYKKEKGEVKYEYLKILPP